MSQTYSLPDYSEIATDLYQAGSESSPAEIHGLLCGLISAGKAAIDWEKIAPQYKEDPHLQDVLQQLYESSYQQMSDFSFEFSLFLPDDNVNIKDRTEALGLWCQGYLAGLKQCKANFDNKSEETLDDLNDITEIAEVDFYNLPETEESEIAYIELVEYIKLAALLIFQDLATDYSHIDLDERDTLH